MKEMKKRTQNKPKSKVPCRTCLLEKNEEDMQEIDDVGNILKDIVPIELVMKDGWPNDICSDCIIQANRAYQFRVMCIKSDEILTERMTEKLKNKDNSDNTGTNGFHFNSKSQAEVFVKEDESFGVFVKEEEIDLGIIKMEDVLFEFCEVKESEICEEEKKSKVCEKEELEEYGMYGKEIKNTNNPDTNDESEVFLVDKSRNETTRQLCCLYCDMKFNDESVLKQHKRKHLKERICHYCNSYIKSKSSYSAHVARHKKQGTYIVCKTCGKSFEFLNNLKQHERIHSNVKKHKCTECDKTFTRANSLKLHLESTVHNKIKRYVCNICDKQFTTYTHLKHHIKYQHILPADQRPYVCACGKSFKEKRKLARHENSVHATVRKFVCDLCEMKFKCKESLYCHKKVHKGIKPFACDICGYAAVVKSSLSRHMRVHSKRSGAEVEPNKS